jgi:hypothetical protein
MAVTVVKTPTGHKLTGSAVTAEITNSTGDAIVTFISHGLTTGDHVYIDSDLDEYNGFWYVTPLDLNIFKISEYDGADFVEYYQDADIDYYLTAEHEWSAAFLPIVYKISNDRWPVNTVDTVRTVSSTADDNGYLDITASGVIKSDIKIFDFVKVSGSPIATLNGVWQVIEVVSSSHVVIDAPYTSTSLAGASIQFYYHNYQVKVKVYAGLPAGHVWETKKPYSEIAELSLTPDDGNEVMFSVADYIKGNLTIRNNPTLYSMPLNLDFFTGFYISTAESFDDSDGYTITEYESAYVDDSFEGFAVAGKLPFKNVYSGFYSDYVYTDGSPASWLTLMTRLLAVEGRYFDLSFIKNIPGNFLIRIDKCIADYLTATEEVQYTDQGEGVYRIPIAADAGYDSFCVTARSSPVSESMDDIPSLSTWVSANVSPGLEDWTTGATPSVSLTAFASIKRSEQLYVDYSFLPGYNYDITIFYDVTGDTDVTMDLMVLDSGFVAEFSNAETVAVGANSTLLSFTATSATEKIAAQATVIGTKSSVFTITNITGVVTSPDLALTEEICIDILESCDAASGFTPTDIRLLEDGSYRILE